MRNSLLEVAIIDIGYAELNERIIQEAIGGSETWLVRVAEELRSQWCQVTVYCNTKKEFRPKRCNVRYVPLETLKEFSFSAHPYYDFIILNRGLWLEEEPIIPLIKKYNLSDCVFIQTHDLSFCRNSMVLASEEQLKEAQITDPIVHGIVCVSDWHVLNTIYQYPFLDRNRIYCISNGVDNKYIKPSLVKDHRILWSSCTSRGLDILVKDILPKVRLYIPDFEIDVATYEEDIKVEGVNFLGRLSKNDLYKEMSKHACWFYPGTFAETFCITMLENIQQGAYPISTFTYGMESVIGDDNKKSIGLKYDFVDNKEEACWEAAHKIVDVIKHYDVYKSKIKNLQEYIKKYNWSDTAKKYIDLYEELSGKYTYDGIFLTMSSNNDFYKEALKTIEDTWAKDLIENKYPRYKFFAYTSCDSDHPLPCIDGHMIYVDTVDDITHTYEKTRAAIHLLNENFTYKYIVRTNTSVYIDVPRMINEYKPSLFDVYGESCGFYLDYIDKKETRRVHELDILSGVCYAMSSNLINTIFTSPYDSDNWITKEGDDVTMSRILEYLDIPYHIHSFYDFPHSDAYVRYKSAIPTSNASGFINNAREASKHVVIQTRSFFNGEERETRGYEYEKMYELHRYKHDVKYREKHYDTLFLAMSCNKPHYKEALKSVEETWGKDLLENKYLGCTFMAYTSCDESHPIPGIEGHMIYVDVCDDVIYTYDKTKRALMLLEEYGITYDTIIRTNTSVFVNIPKMLEVCCPINDEIYGEIMPYGMMGFDPEKQENRCIYIQDVIAGLCWGTSFNMIKNMFFKFDVSDVQPKDCDDITMSRILNINSIPYSVVPFYPNIPDKFLRYNAYKKEDELYFNDHGLLHGWHSDDINEAMNVPIVQIRSLYDDDRRSMEIDTMHELYSEFQKIRE